MGMEVLFFLLPIAALSGWLIGRRQSGIKTALDKNCPPHLNSRYFQGLNYLLDEQPDAALDVFIGISETDSESVEIQFALASLFLRRGEVDRAIRIHQNLIARPTLSKPHRQQALYALAMDYMSAGLLDRAENLFHDLLDDPQHRVASLKHLLEILQQEKEWEKAIEVTRQMRGQGGSELAPVVAQYHCELAEQAAQNGDLTIEDKQLRQAIKSDKHCVRASLLDTERLMRQGKYQQAILASKRVEQQNPDYLPLILKPLHQCYTYLNQLDRYQDYLSELAQRHNLQPIHEALFRLWLEQDRLDQAEALITQKLSQNITLHALSCLLDLIAARRGGPGDLQRLREVVDALLQNKPKFQCRQCGFHGSKMLWQCPGCKQWSSIKPV